MLYGLFDGRDSEFWSSGGDLSRNRDAIKREMARISSEVDRIREEITQMVIDAATPLFSKCFFISSTKVGIQTHPFAFLRIDMVD